jgi:hypothetical protein
VLLVFAALALQDPDPVEEPKPKPPIVRRMKAGQADVYSVSVTSSDVATEQRNYTMRVSIVKEDEQEMVTEGEKAESTVRKAHALLENLHYRSENVDQKDRRPFGGIPLTLDQTGFPGGLTFQGMAIHYSIPLVAWYLPPDEVKLNESFDVQPANYFPNLVVSGKARLARPERQEQRLTFNFVFQVEGEELTRQNLRTLNGSSWFDPKDGRLLRADGKFTTSTGTITFALKRV